MLYTATERQRKSASQSIERGTADAVAFSMSTEAIIPRSSALSGAFLSLNLVWVSSS